MATTLKNLSSSEQEIPTAFGMRIGIAVSNWNKEITDNLLKGAVETLIHFKVETEDIIIKRVPGSFELSLAAQFFAEYNELDAIICLGAVIRGETPHFDYICQAVAQGLTHVSLEYNIPVVFGVLTTDTLKQAEERAGGKLGNKGVEAALTAIQMSNLQDDMIEEDDSEDDLDDTYLNN